MTSVTSCTRFISGDTSVFDSELGDREKKSTKVVRISRHVILAIVLLFTLTVFGYSISFPLECGQQVQNKTCAISQGKDVCSRSSCTAISVGISVMILGLCMLIASYRWLICGLILSITLQCTYILALWLYDNPTVYTDSSANVVMEEMMQCRVITNSTYMSPESKCWDMFREKYCDGWILAETKLCSTFASDCNTENNLWCNDDKFTKYMNFTTLELVEQCINGGYYWWAFSINQEYYNLALNLLVNTTAVHVLLLSVLISTVLLYEYLKKHILLEILEENEEQNTNSAE